MIKVSQYDDPTTTLRLQATLEQGFHLDVNLTEGEALSLMSQLHAALEIRKVARKLVKLPVEATLLVAD